MSFPCLNIFPAFEGGEFWNIWMFLAAAHFATCICIDMCSYAFGSREEKESTKAYFLKASAESGGNLVFVLPFFIAAVLNNSNIAVVLNKDNEWFASFTLMEALQVVFYLLVFRAWFVVSHYALHWSSWLRENVHYVHHFYKHTIASDSLAMHPLEFILVAMIGGALGPFVLPPLSSRVIYIYLLISVVLNCVVHSQLSKYVYLGRHVMHHLKPSEKK